jgi:hypothetical protein
MSAIGGIADNPAAPAIVRYWTKADKGRFWAGRGLSAYDPKRTSATDPVFLNYATDSNYTGCLFDTIIHSSGLPFSRQLSR